ncbi:hypothetical protein FKP32DRAFT_209125 [Trametes sanguinea]|nr:hypothetical protein FKP32DRAFT_209125 [Trametes sanguinea]
MLSGILSIESRTSASTGSRSETLAWGLPRSGAPVSVRKLCARLRPSRVSASDPIPAKGGRYAVGQGTSSSSRWGVPSAKGQFEASTFERWGSAARRRAGRRAKSDDRGYRSEERPARITACPRLRERIRVLGESTLPRFPSALSMATGHSWLSKRLRDVIHGNAQCLTSATAKPDTSQPSSSVSAANRIGATGARGVSAVQRGRGCQQASAQMKRHVCSGSGVSICRHIEAPARPSQGRLVTDGESEHDKQWCLMVVREQVAGRVRQAVSQRRLGSRGEARGSFRRCKVVNQLVQQLYERGHRKQTFCQESSAQERQADEYSPGDVTVLAGCVFGGLRCSEVKDGKFLTRSAGGAHAS